MTVSDIAVAQDEIFESADACMTKARAIEDVTASLSALGWTEIAADEIDDTGVRQLAWTYLTRFGASDAPATLTRELEAQERTVRGLLRKVDIDTNKSRFLRRQVAGHSEIMLVAWREPVQGVVETDCRIAAAEPSMSAFVERLEQLVGWPITDFPDFAPFPAHQPEPETSSEKRTATVYVLDRASLSEKVGSTVEVQAVIETYFRYRLAE